ncbi:hypothetical protein RJ639_043545 [Escallonia herrerae]|uniref:Uncharacterized protein n=1 Tax=Escallonia herrerae TaxID=1293975 RepID=A0AA88WBJ9_9ASTE|nr:hypothetical protein RJ639_043545 [Escallonia herrerae]
MAPRFPQMLRRGNQTVIDPDRNLVPIVCTSDNPAIVPGSSIALKSSCASAGVAIANITREKSSRTAQNCWASSSEMPDIQGGQQAVGLGTRDLAGNSLDASHNDAVEFFFKSKGLQELYSHVEVYICVSIYVFAFLFEYTYLFDSFIV